MDCNRPYFFDKDGDERMVKQNPVNWQALANLVERESRTSLPQRPWDILDLGCHTGGFLELINNRFGKRLDGGSFIKSLAGVEPIESARDEAEKRMPWATFDAWIEETPTCSIDLVVGHEFLYLVQDLYFWTRQLKRILRPEGGAFISLGSHGENTAWLRWRKPLLELYGHTSYIYQPINILDTGYHAGFNMELHRLHTQPQTEMRYSPPEDGWGEFVSAKEALDFQQQKYVFIFYPKR